MHVHRPDHRAQEDEELHVGVRVVLRIEQVDAGVGGHRPVVVLAAAVHAGERLLVQQRLEVVTLGHPAQDLHQHHLVVAGDVRRLEQRGDFVLAGRDFVVPRLHRHADAEHFRLGIGHEREHARRNRAEVVIVELLTLGRPGAEQRALARHEVGTAIEQLAVDQEVFLLRTDGGDDAGDAGVGAEEPEDPHRLLGERFHRAQQRNLGVERFTGPGDEPGRNAERDRVAVAIEERGRGRVPRGVAAGLERRAQAAGGERRGVGLALREVGAGEVVDHATHAIGRHERVVLLGRQPGQRLEPVGEMRRAAFHGPVLHRRGHDVGDARVERLAVIDGAQQRLVDRLGQALLHHLLREGVYAEQLIDSAVGGGNVGHGGVLGIGWWQERTQGKGQRSGSQDIVSRLST